MKKLYVGILLLMLAWVNVAHAAPITDLYYVALQGGTQELRSIGFDGTSFSGSYTTVATPSPQMDANSVFTLAAPSPNPPQCSCLELDWSDWQGLEESQIGHK
jgi:hypothetical protein